MLIWNFKIVIIFELVFRQWTQHMYQFQMLLLNHKEWNRWSYLQLWILQTNFTGMNDSSLNCQSTKFESETRNRRLYEDWKWGEGRRGAGKVRPCCVFLGQRVEVINPRRFVVGGGGCKLTFKDRAINNDTILNQFFTILVQFKGCFGLRVRSVFFRTPLGLFDFLFLPLKDSRRWR